MHPCLLCYNGRGDFFMFDYHVHSQFSGDSEQNIRELLDYAVTKRLSEIAITDHMDYEYNYKEIYFEFDVDEHREVFNDLKKEYDGRIDVKRGLEIGLQPHVLKRCEELVRGEKFDFVIASVHECEMKDFYAGDFFEGRSADDAMNAYLREMTEMVRDFKDFNVLGHIDFLKRYSPEVKALDQMKYFDRYEEVMKILIKREQGIEINTSGIRQGTGGPFPDFKLLELYYELGGEVITLGSDSHVKEDLCSDFEYVRKKLIDIGFKNIFTFKEMKPFEVGINNVRFV